MTTPNWPGDANKPALGYRAGFARKSLQLPFATAATPTEADAPEILWGTGSPEGVVVGTIGDLYLDYTTPGFYQKLTGVDTNTGWSLMGLTSGQASQLAGVGRFIEVRSRAQAANDQDDVIISEIQGYGRFGPGFGSSPNNLAIWNAAFSTRATIKVSTVADDRRAFLVKPSSGASSAGNSVNMIFRPHVLTSSIPESIDFRPTVGTFTSTPTSDVPMGMCAAIRARLRKETGGDGSHARFCFGFADAAVTFPSGPISRIGLIGDGLGGYRFGSVNCSDGLGSGDNGATDIDPNAVAPAELLNANLGTKWFDVEIRMTPPTPTQAGRWRAFLNGVLIATFSSSVNFPRGSQTTNRHYAHIQPCIQYFSDASALPGVLVEDLRVIFDEEYGR